MSNRFPTAKYVGDAKVSGSLYDLGDYPGLLVNESKTLVTGEVYEIDDGTLEQLDEFEASSNYIRKQVEVSADNERTLCWVYEPDPDSYDLHKLISSGDWIEYARTKSNDA